MIHIYNSRVSSFAEALIISCWFLNQHQNVVMLNILHIVARRCLLRSRRQQQATSRSCGKCQQGGTQCPPVLQEEERLFAPEVGGDLSTVRWSAGVTAQCVARHKHPATDPVLRNTATRITHDSNLSMFGGDFLPTLGESPPTSDKCT